MARYLDYYKKEIIPEMMKKFGYKNKLAVPALVKIVINRGVGAATQDPKLIDSAISELADITGQKPVVTRSKKSIANFKLREGIPIGCKVTLRGKIMYEFVDRFVNIALPRIRDFRGVSAKSFDGSGNYCLGIKEQIIFPEIDLDKVQKRMGMDIIFVTTAKKDEEAMELLRLFGLPFR